MLIALWLTVSVSYRACLYVLPGILVVLPYASNYIALVFSNSSEVPLRFVFDVCIS